MMIMECKSFETSTSSECTRPLRESLVRCVLGCSLLVFLTSICASCTILPALQRENSDSFGFLRHRHLEEEEKEDYHAFNFSEKTEGAPQCHDIPPKEINFTLVTQLSAVRLSLMEEHCRRWGPHPISVAVGSHGSPKAIEKVLSGMGCDMSHVTLTVVGGYDDKEYPVNHLRNEAFRAVKTSHAVYVDADFIFSKNLYESLMQHRPSLTDPKTALVMPAFDITPICPASEPECKKLHLSIVPETKDQLKELFELSKPPTADSKLDGLQQSVPSAIKQFDVKNNFHGHGSTRYEDWLTQSRDELLPIECISSFRYEPYLVVRYCEDLPPFQEAFTGYGKNKISWTHHVRRVGYKLYQLGDSFLTHVPHKKSDSFKKWNGIKATEGKEALRQNQIFEHFQNWLENHVPDKSQIPDCPSLEDEGASSTSLPK